MDADFWHDKWQRMEVGFHQEAANPALTRHWSTLGLLPKARVLVPLCGASLDLIWLQAQGHSIIGVELSEKALDGLAERFASDRGLSLQKAAVAGQVHYRGQGVLLIAGDFFALDPTTIGPVDAVYDRAALVALPAPMRGAYVRQVRFLAPAAPQLLVTLDYDQQQMAGPPFAVNDAEVASHYAADYYIECLEERELIDHEPRFRARGLDSFRQRVYRLAVVRF